MVLKLFVLSSLLLATLLGLAESQLQNQLLYRSIDPSDIAKLTSAVAKTEPRQMGLLGFTALGAIMFPILVSLGMASFVSHLPTVFKEFATEFGIPSTPPRNFLFYRQKRNAFEDRWTNILKSAHAHLIKTLEERDDLFKYKNAQ